MASKRSNVNGCIRILFTLGIIKDDTILERLRKAARECDLPNAFVKELEIFRHLAMSKPSQSVV
ncbi:MAG: hypothetical protein IKP58_08920 [Victivallales bacterium]|nr:hypothetical protein [Victivallales bacterium]